MLFNDVILRVAFEHRAAVIDLRLVCTEFEDYANPIEPSGHGGLKIAKRILGATGVDSTGSASTVLFGLREGNERATTSAAISSRLPSELSAPVRPGSAAPSAILPPRLVSASDRRARPSPQCP